MQKQKQLNLFQTPSLEHGGDIRKGNRKTARVIDTKRAIHLVMRSTRAKNNWSMLLPRNRKQVQALLHRASQRFHVKVYQFANSGNHLHILVKCQKRRDFQNFLRFLAGGIAFAVTNAKKGCPVGGFWDALAYSRVVDWGRPFEIVKTYLTKNWVEAARGDFLTASKWQVAWRDTTA